MAGEHNSSLAAGSGEVMLFRDWYLNQDGKPLHPFSSARRYKDSWGLGVVFLPAESPEERAKLMDFRLDCITRFFPCMDEKEILPGGAHMLEELDLER